jgi:hypothetical protein
MSLSHSPSIVTNGLILCLDPDNTKSYPGTGSSITNIIDGTNQTLNGTFSKSSLGIRLTNTNASLGSNVSRLNINTYSSIRTISLWVNIINFPAGGTYVLDARNGLTNGYLWYSGIGNTWINMSTNGQNKVATNLTDSFTTGSWRFLTYESNAFFTDNVTMFSRFTNDEGMNCTFGEILFYNRVLTNAEISQNFNALKSRYGL